MGRLTCIALLLFATCAGVAAAAPPWSAPESVSSPSLFVDSPHVALDGQGRAYATWVWTRGTGPDATGGWRIAVREPGAGEFGPERSAPNLVTRPVPYGTAVRVLALDQRTRGRGLISLRARFSRPDGSFLPPDTISTYVPAGGSPSLAVHDNALAAWTAQAARGRRIVRAALRRPGGRFGKPVTLRARGRARNVVAGAGPGVLFVAWERAGVVEARVRMAGRPGWRSVQRLGRTSKGSTIFRVAFSGKRGYLVWMARSAESAELRRAVLPAGGTRFRTARTIDTIAPLPPDEDGSPLIVPIPERDALLAWTRWDGTNWRVHTAVSGADTRFGAPFAASPAGQHSVLGAAASIPSGERLPGGTVLLAWSRLDAPGEIGDRVQAALRPPGGSFGAPEDLSDLDRARLPAVAFDSSFSRWTAVWSQRIGPDGPGVPQSQITTFARSSTRPG